MTPAAHDSAGSQDGGRVDSPGAKAGGPPGSSTALAAATYTLVAAAQKGSGFILLILFTRVLTPAEYGQIALLTTVGAFLVVVLSLGLEPRIIYAYFRADAALPQYLRAARRVSIVVPILVATLASVLVLASPLSHKPAWVMECFGASLLAAGTTYAYAVLRSSRRVVPYLVLALSILAAQVASRIVFVAVLDAGAVGWAASDLLGGMVAVVASLLVVPRVTVEQSSGSPVAGWTVVRDGLPLVPHSLAQWGLSLSDRLILAFFVTTAAIGVYSALYQVAAVASMILTEVNRAFMPLYARNAPGAHELRSLVRTHLSATFILHAVFVLLGFAVIEIVLPLDYSSRDEIYPVLALAALAYGLYFVPMNGLTLVAGNTTRAPVISLTALGVNVALIVALAGTWGLWGAVVGTAAGYSALAGIAWAFESRTRAIPWSSALRERPWALVTYVGVIGATGLATWPGAPRTCALVLLGVLLALMLAAAVRDRAWHPARVSLT